MSETSEDKTIRNFTTLLDQPYFGVQISILYPYSYDSKKAADHKPIITERIRKAFPNQCFLYRLCLFEVDIKNLEDLKDRESGNQQHTTAYHTLFTNEKVSLEKIKASIEKHCGCEVRVKQQVFGNLKKSRYISAVKKGKPYDLRTHFNSNRPIRRYAVIGEKHLLD